MLLYQTVTHLFSSFETALANLSGNVTKDLIGLIVGLTKDQIRHGDQVYLWSFVLSEIVLFDKIYEVVSVQITFPFFTLYFVKMSDLKFKTNIFQMVASNHQLVG